MSVLRGICEFLIFPSEIDNRHSSPQELIVLPRFKTLKPPFGLFHEPRMKSSHFLIPCVLCLLLTLTLPVSAAIDTARLAKLDEYWTTVSKAVRIGDFALYESTCHPEGVLVSGIRKESYPLRQALARWKKEFDDTAAGTRTSDVAFRFNQRWGDATTAYETGMFLYTATLTDGTQIKEFIHLETMLLLVDGHWLVMMEYQKAVGTEAEWQALAATKDE